MSTPIPGDVLPLWNPDIPGEEITTGRLGIRVRPGTPAAAKVFALEAHGGAELLRQVLQEQKLIDGTYTIVKPEKPLEFVGQVSTTLLTGKLGRTPMGLALEISDWQELEGTYEMEKNRLRLGYQELHVVKEWDGDLEGFTAIVLREQAKTHPMLDSTMRFIEHLRDYREKLAEAAVRRYEATEQWIECPKCETEVPTSNGIHCPNCGEDMRGGEYVRAILHLVDDADGRIYRGIDSLTVRSAGFPEYRGMALDRIQGSNLWVSFRRYDPLPDEGIVLPTASVEMFEAQRSVIRQLQIGSPRTGALAAELADTGWLGSPPRVPLDGKRAHHLPDPNEEQAEADAGGGRRPRSLQPRRRHVQPPRDRLAPAVQDLRLADPRRSQQGARQRGAGTLPARQAMGDDRRPQAAPSRHGGGRVHVQDRAAARRGRARRQLLWMDVGRGAGLLENHAAPSVPHAGADRPRRVGPLLRRQAHPRGAASAYAAALAFRPRAGLGRHRRAGRVSRCAAFGCERVRGRAVQGHHVDHPQACAEGQARRDRHVQLAGEPPAGFAEGNRAARRHRVGRCLRGPRVGRRHPFASPLERSGGHRLPQRPQPRQRRHLAREKAARHRRGLEDRDRWRPRAVRTALRARPGGWPRRRSGRSRHRLPACRHPLACAAPVATAPRRAQSAKAAARPADARRRCRQRRDSGHR